MRNIKMETRLSGKGVSRSNYLLAATAMAGLLMAPGVAQAQSEEGASSADRSSEIVVTAQFREQALQDTPLAITAVSGESLAARGITNTQDLGKVAPSVNLRHTGSAGGKTMAAFIRGIGASDYNFNIEPGVAFYIDDVYLGPSWGTFLDFIDLERAEVLRGPQGTLSGKNAIGGAVRLVTQKPRGTNTGYMEVETGSRKLLKMKGAWDIGLSDNLAMRVSGYAARQDGLVKLLDFGCANPTLVGDTSAPYSIANTTPPQDCQRGTLGNTDVQAARLQLRWTPTDNLEINLSGGLSEDNAAGAADVLVWMDPAGFANLKVPGTDDPYFLTYYGVPYDTRFVPTERNTSYATFEDPVYGLKFNPDNTLSTRDVTLHVNLDINPDLQLTSITGYRRIAGSWAYDSDSSPLSTDAVHNTQRHEQFSQELRLSGSSLSDRFNWTVGGFYYHAKQRDIGTIEAVPFNLFIQVDSYPKNTNWAAFAHGEFAVTDQLRLIGGIRYSEEDKDYRFIEHDIPGTPSNVFPGGLDAPKSTSYERVDWRAGIQFDVNDDHMIYANVATGFRGGGFNPRPSNLQTVVPFEPESLISYEIGHRSEFWDRRIRWNNTFYYGDYTNIQLSGRTTSIVAGGEFPVTVIINAAKAHIWGIESEFNADVSDNFMLYAMGSYTKFKYDELGTAGPAYVGNGPLLTSMQRFTPEWKFKIGFQATLPVMEDLGKLVFTGDYAYQTKQYSDARNSPALEIPGYGVANARLTFTTADEAWALSVYGSNIFDKEYFYNRGYVSGNWQIKGNPAPGAEWGVSLRRNF